MSEEPPPTVTPDTATGPDADLSHGDVRLAGATRFADTIGRLADQARRTTSAAKARRMATGGGEPGGLEIPSRPDQAWALSAAV